MSQKTLAETLIQNKRAELQMAIQSGNAEKQYELKLAIERLEDQKKRSMA